MYVKLFYSKISPTPKPKCFIKLNHSFNNTKIYIMQEILVTQRGGKNGGLKNEEIFVQLFNQSQDSWAASIFSKKCVLSESYLVLKRQIPVKKNC